jgi:hypothetical protein
MKTIALSQGQVALVDDEDYEELAKHKWCAQWARTARTFYGYRKTRTESGTWVGVTMHRAILGASAGQQVDHRNHNGLDNRRENLRLCTRAENNRNARKRRDSASRYKGVALLPSGRWRASMRLDGRMKHLGVFATETEAALAYNRAASAASGEFALLNEVEG